jgi:hypothetical protein
MQLRICVAAIVIQNGQLLVIRKRLDDGEPFIPFLQVDRNREKHWSKLFNEKCLKK